MTAPFRIEPDPPKRPQSEDPFLEFDSERPSIGLFKPNEDTRPAPLPPAPNPSASERPKSAINPTVAFAIGVAGLVTAAVGYYQMVQVLASRSDTAQPGASAQAAGSVKTVGDLEITSDPSGATVTVDGIAWGVTPLSVKEIPAGKHQVVISRGASSVTRDVDLAGGSTAFVTAVLSPVAPARAAAPSAARPPAAERTSAAATTGWITVQAPIALRVLERGRARGTTRDGRIALGEGARELELVSDTYEIRHAVAVTIVAGRGTLVNVPWPSGSLSINATPWADVWVDGNSVGTTPLANLTLPVGRHEVVLRHPTLGERRQTVDVKAVTPTRLGVALR